MYYKRYVFHFEKRRLRINRVEFYADALLRSITKHSVYLNVHICQFKPTVNLQQGKYQIKYVFSLAHLDLQDANISK